MRLLSDRATQRIEGAIDRTSPARAMLLGLVVRLVYGLALHPIHEHLRSDMSGYAGRAAKVVSAPLAVDPKATFFPWGTHVLAAGARALGERAWGPAITIVYALLGALTVFFTARAAEELLPREHRRVARAIGLVAALYAPWIEHGGFLLSETPFALCVAASTYFGARFAQRERFGDVLALGASIAIGATFRPQISIALPLVAFALARLWRPVPPKRAVRAIAVVLALSLPFAIALGGSALRAKHHLGHYAGFSTNGAFNLVLGRCHATTLDAKSSGSRFQPPSFLRLERFEEQNGFAPLFQLDPAMGSELRIPAPAWDEAAAMRMVRQCIEKTGWARQLEYSLEHVALLWLYNVPWPTVGPIAAASAIFAPVFGVVGLVAALAALVRGRSLGVAIASAQPLSMVLAAMLVFGEARLRLPYDGVLLTLAASAILALRDRWRATSKESSDHHEA
jgi:hypothetical protein